MYCSPGRIYSGLFCRLSYYCYLTAKLDYYKSHHPYPQALRCLEGTTLSNRGQRPRIQGAPRMLPGRQYARGQAPGSSEVTVRSLRWRLILYCQRQLFCFVAFPSACGQTRRMWMVRQGSSLSWLSIRIGLQGRKPRESNKLFDLFYRPRT